MAGPPSSRKRKYEDLKGKPKRAPKKFKKQTDYDSGSGDDSNIPADQDFKAINLANSDDEDDTVTTIPGAPALEADSDDVSQDDEPNVDEASDSDVTDGSGSEDEDDSEENSDVDANPNLTKPRKRNDPEAFATSMSKILSSKLSTSKRSDPVLSRSITALEASKEITDLALEKRAKHKLMIEKRAALDKGRVKDVLGASTAFDAALMAGMPGPSVQETMELEKRLRKTAQRGVVKLFNAVRAAQVKGEQAAKDARTKGIIGAGRREEKVTEMSKQGFLDLIAGGNGTLKAGAMEEA